MTENRLKHDQLPFGKVMIVGLGMIGGSFAKALKERGLAELYAVDRREGELALGVSTGVIDYPAELTEQFIAQMDVIVLATPVRAMASVLAEIKPYLAAHTLLTDVGSTKGSVVEAAVTVFGCMPANFIPGHPIAGAEKSGVLAANPQLFEKHMAIVTPVADSDPVLVDRLHRLWRAIGADVVSMDVDHHDHVLASSSHLPHLLAYTLVDALANSDRSQDVFKFAAGGFRDFTRIASSDPVMWRDVFLANKDATLATLDQFTERLADMRDAIEQGDGASMFGVFTRAKSARDHFLRLLEQRTIAPQKDTSSVSLSVLPASVIKGKVSLPGDKSLSHIAITMAALSRGVSHLTNVCLDGGVRVTIQALRDMGVVIETLSESSLRVHGVGLRGLKAPIAPINLHQSELSLYVLLPVLAGQPFVVSVTADDPLLNHVRADVFDLMRAMGTELEFERKDCLPVKMCPTQQAAFSLSLEGASQKLIVSAFMACLFAEQEANLTEAPEDVTQMEVLLQGFGVRISRSKTAVSVASGELVSTDVEIVADMYSCAWMALLASLLPGSELVMTNLGLDARAFAYFTLLKQMGADIELPDRNAAGLYEGQVLVRFAELSAFQLSVDQTCQLRTLMPLLCVAAAYAKGESRIEGIGQLPYYHEDRVLALVEACNLVQVNAQVESGCLRIDGGVPQGGELDCAGDQYLALAMLVLGARSKTVTQIEDCQTLLEEFSELDAQARQLGLHCSVAQ
ncbi:prephenate dehydrogenase/arogenate dehydrogenase family protein [Marinomonas posidonica]|uniref:prephenate dehydrogenase/arogenate dehydrogenase family protein n=1 Tax=Marinomonas posidonica TaxID=936476 RepID=UPI001FE07B01|nr:prephenate dehydrogenase/arogenate dehydrogenase family protein [Marinomonas posidonica]